MLYCNYFYTMGRTHQICEDFAIQGEIPIPFIVICDGCSASYQSDLGAYILASTSKRIIENSASWPLDYLSFGQKLIVEASQTIETMKATTAMKVTTEALDATVILAFFHQGAIQVYMYGDGALLLKDKSGHVNTIEVAFTHNAPFYLSYWLDKMRQAEYAKHDPNPLLIKDSLNGQSKPLPFKKALSFSFPLQQFPVVAIASDGVTQCFNLSQSKKLPLASVGHDFLAIKEVTGEFVKRHSQQVLEDYEQRRIFPLDDLSIGMFVQYD